ncbi:MAG: hypothetical protein QNJ74_14365 [Trichodesmium sp. MO_231.B1]|nr:hypothetical protein [Okeania sp. SIO2F4]MDJ0517375.1 hypothetical protein [Trichodesmium sp. MO_231.B1]
MRSARSLIPVDGVLPTVPVEGGQTPRRRKTQGNADQETGSKQ